MSDLLLEATGIVKSYGAVRALRGASLAVRPGEVHALMGANGAGKSTLVKILTGAVSPDAGTMTVRGTQQRIRSPRDARRSGLLSVYQEPALIPDLSVRDNLVLTETPQASFHRWMDELGLSGVDVGRTTRDLPLAVLRVIDLARALAAEPDVLLLDEMTAALPADLSERVLEVVRRQRGTGGAVIFISHRMLEVSAACDRATVLRDGETVGIVEIGPGAAGRIVDLMLGTSDPALATTDLDAPPTADLADVVAAGAADGPPIVEEPGDGTVTPTPVSASAAPAAVRATSSPGTAQDEPALEVRGLGYGHQLHDVSFEIRPGEVLGMVGLEAQGQDELFDILSGGRRPQAGEILVDGRTVRFGHPADAIRAGLVYVPADRAQALLAQRSVRENIALPASAGARHWGPIDMGGEKRRVGRAIERLQIDTRAQSEVRRLSGGNQQKVTLARWIAGGVRTLLCFDPTRGIDIRTKREIYRLVRDLAASGAAVLLYTSELEEIRLACDRVIVLFAGRIVDEMPADVADEPTLMRAAHGLPAEVTAA
jgi:ribose transport system ATP-binding protein